MKPPNREFFYLRTKGEEHPRLITNSKGQIALTKQQNKQLWKVKTKIAIQTAEMGAERQKNAFT